jgi:hypothetical protein
MEFIIYIIAMFLLFFAVDTGRDKESQIKSGSKDYFKIIILLSLAFVLIIEAESICNLFISD